MVVFVFVFLVVLMSVMLGSLTAIFDNGGVFKFSLLSSL